MILSLELIDFFYVWVIYFLNLCSSLVSNLIEKLFSLMLMNLNLKK